MTDYLHRPTGLQAGTTYRVDTGATNGTAATITRVDPKTAIDGSKVRAGDDGTVTSFVGTAATLYLRPLDYLGNPGTAVTSTGYTFPTPAPDTGAQTTGALPATGYTGVADLSGATVTLPAGMSARETIQTIASSGATYTLNLASGTYVKLTLTANCTLTFPSAPSGYTTSFTLEVVQDGTGSRTITWPAAVKWAGSVAPVLSTAAAAVDIFTFYTADAGTTWRGFLAGADVR